VAYERAAKQTNVRAVADKLRAELAQADDESILNAKDVNRFVSQRTRKMLYGGVLYGDLPIEVHNEQVYDAALIGKAHKEGKPMFLLASQPGSGKTFIIGAAIERMRQNHAENQRENKIPEADRKPLRVIYVTLNEELKDQFKKNLSGYDIGDIEYMSYAALDNKDGDNPPTDSDVIIFDEAHNVRYSVSGDASNRAVIAGEWMKKSKFTLLASATPYEDLEQMRFLWAAGAYKPFDREDLRGDTDDGWFGFAEVLGADVVLDKDNKPTGTKFPEDETQLAEMRFTAREYLRKRGMFSQRKTRIPGERIVSNFTAVKAEEQWVKAFDATVAALAKMKNANKGLKAWVINFQKRILEASKQEAAVKLAREDVAAGKRVVIFIETRSARDRDLPQIVQDYRDWVDSGRDPKTKPDSVPGVDDIDLFFEGMIEEGVDRVTFPEAQDYYTKALGDLNVVFYTGNESAGQGKTSLAKWESGEASVMVATMGKGGTGLSLHDTLGVDNGGAERSQIILNLPWLASQTEQVAGRTARYGMKSNALIHWLFTKDIEFDFKLAQKVGNRMASMNSLVQGEITPSAERVVNYRMDQVEDIDKNLEEREMEGIELSAEEANAVAQGTLLDMAAVETEEDAVYRKVVEDNKITQKTSMAAWEGKEKNRATVALLRTMLINAGLKPDANLVAWDEDGNVIAPSVRAQAGSGAQAESGAQMSAAKSETLDFKELRTLKRSDFDPRGYEADEGLESASVTIGGVYVQIYYHPNRGYWPILREFRGKGSDYELSTYKTLQEAKSEIRSAFLESADIRQSAPSLSPVYGLVKRKLTIKDKLHVKEAFRILRKAIPQIDSLVVVDSLENLLKRTDLTQKEKDTLKGPNFAQGIFSNGRAFVAYNNVVRTDLHASEAAAIAGVMVHELMHKGSAIMRLSPDLAPVYANWKSMLDEYVSNADIERLVLTSHPGYANWKNNTALRESAQEEVFVKRIEALFHKGNLLEDAEKTLMQKFLSIIKALVNKLLGNNMSKSDEVVARWARFFVVATANRHMNMNGMVDTGVMTDEGVRASMAPGESPRDGDVPRPASLFSTYLTPEEAAAVEAAAARMDAGRAEGEEDSLAKFAREQVLGQAGVGMIYKQQQLAPQQAYAMGYIGFAEDSSGLPIVNPAATKKAKSIALELLNPKSFFAMRYQEEAGNFDAAAAVLQLELTRYAIAMLAKGDASLLSTVRRNWNNIIMGKYLTMAAAGRLLQARSHYTGVVAQTLDEMTAEQNKTALKLLKEQKAKDPIRTLQDMENAVANALPDYSALWNALGKGVPDPNGKPDLNWLEKAMGALDSNTMQMFGLVMSDMGRLSRMVDARSKMKDDDIRRSLPDWGAAPEGEEFPTDPDELDRLIEQTREKIAGGLDALVAAMGLQPLPPEVKKTLEDNAPKAKRKPAPAKPPVAADAPGVIPPAKQKEINDAIDEVESLREEGDNKATLAAIDKLERLIADLANVPSPTFPSESIKAQIRLIVAEYIRNANNMAYSDFRDSMAADLEDKIPETIREEIQDKLIQATWQTFDRAANKTAEAMLAKMKSVEDIKYGKPDKAVQVRKEVRAAIINRDGLTELVLVKRLTDALVALTVEKDVAAELAQEAYGQSVRYAAKKLALRIAKITESLTSGGNKRMLAAMAKASPDMVSDPTWQHNAVRSVFEASGLTFAEAEVAATNTTSRFAEIFANSGVRIERNAQTRMQDAVVRLIDRYAALQSDTPDLKAAAEIRKRNINDLFRQQVRIPLEQDEFETMAMAMGATRQQAMILFYEAETENRYSKQRGTDRLVLTKLIEFIKEMSPAELNDPTARDTAVEAFLKSNGFTPEQIREVKPNVLSKLDKYLGEARQAALTRILKQNEAYKKLLETRDGTFLTQAQRELKATLEKIRLGIADTTSSVAQLLAASDKDNPTKFLKTDMVTLAQLDNRITAAEKDGRTHDAALAVRELFELLARRRAIEPASLDRLAIAYNNSALSGVATLGINIYGPVGSMLTRVGMDLMRAATRGNWDMISLVFSSLTDTFSMAYSEGALSIRGDAYTNAMQRVILKVNNLRQGAEKSLEILKNKKAKPWERTKALVDVIQSYTDITRRILSAADQTWFATMEGYFYKLEASKALLKNKIPLPVVQKAIFDITETTRLRITNDKMMIGRYAARVEELRGKTEKEFRAGINAIVFDESYLDDGSIDLTDEVRKYRTTLDNELRSIIRAAALPYKSRPDQAVDMVLKELNLQNLAVDLRQRDLVKRDIRSFLEEGVKGLDGEEYAGVGKEEALRIEDFARRESEYETGNHKGEKGSQLDIFNQFSMLIQNAGYSVIQKNPILGRMLLGYFGVPVNLLNRSLWFTPYGLLRYAVAKRIDGIGMPNSEFYQQSMKTTQDMKQRLSEAILGTSVFAFAIALQALGDDDEEELFNVTLAGPTNKTEYDAWVKNGHRKGAIEMNIDGKVYSLNWARGLLEPWKPAMVALGAFDDMKLNRKLGDRENVVPIVDYLAAAASGFGQQASFFGAKTTIGSTFSATPDTNLIGTLAYKVSPMVPFSGLMNSVSKFYTGPNTYRGREGAIWANIPIVSMFATNRAVNALGDPVGVTGDPIAVANDRAWYAGMPLNVGGKMSGNDAKVYEFILERGTGPGIPQRSAIETKNGFITDAEFLDYVAFRGRIVKSQMIRDLPKLRAMDDDSLSKAMGEISTKATTDAKKRFRYE
jgi:hypothetical protein